MSPTRPLVALLAALTFGLAAPAIVHAHDHAEDGGDIALQMAFYKSLVDFSERFRASAAVTPTWKIAGERVNMKGALADLVVAKLRLWHTPLREECGDCVPPDPAVWDQEAKALVAKGFVETKIGDRVLDGLEHIALSTADLGAAFGLAPATAKATAETGEQVMAIFKSAGVHFLCPLIDAMILFGTRPLITATSAFAWAPSVGASRLATFARVGLMSSAIRRAERRVEFVKDAAAELSPEDVAEIDREGPRRYWGYLDKLGLRGKRAPWLEKLERRGKLKLDGRVARGRRMKRYLFLLRRRVGHSKFLKGKDPMEQALDHDIVWALSVQENIAQPAFKFKDQPPAAVLDSLADLHTPKTDEVRTGIAERFGKGNALQTELMAEVLREVEVVFNPDVPKKIRYFQAKKIEAILFGFTRDNFLATMHQAGEIYSNEVEGFWAKFGAIYRRVRMHVRAGRFSSYVLGIGNFMRVASSTRNAAMLTEKKYETMEAVRRIFETLQVSGQFAEAKTVDDLVETENALARARRTLLAYRPWKTKRVAYSWIPFRRPRPHCDDMNRMDNR